MSNTYAPTLPPSAYQLEQSVAEWQRLQDKLTAEDSMLEQDEYAVSPRLTLPDGSTVAHPRELLARAVDAAIWAAMRAAEAKAVKDRMAARQKRYEAREEAIRTTIAALSDVLGVTALEGELGAFSMAQGRRSVVITDEKKLSLDYIRVVSSPDKEAIGQALTAGETVDGAEFSNPGKVVRITPY